MTKYVVAGTLLAMVGLGLVWAAKNSDRPAGNSGHQSTATAAKVNSSQDQGAPMVRVKVFNRQGELVGPVESPRFELTAEQWRERLTAEQFKVLRSAGTERPFCGVLLDNKKVGVYTCAGCGLPLFTSSAKFNSGTGWPSFFKSIAKENVAENADHSHGMMRVEINCARCDGHLGHVFDDGPQPTGLRYCLNSASLSFTAEDEVATLADPSAEATATATKVSAQKPAGERVSIVLGGGCFWCTEAAFEQLEGVYDVMAGYAGGTKETANYEAVCAGRTGHAEVIRVTYDPQKITLDKLLDVFFDAHDPTTLNRQGNDRGTQYRSVIFYGDDAEHQAAKAKIEQLTAAKTFSDPIVTTLEPLTTFYPAEDYHQDYARLNPFQPYILGVSTPKACKVREKHAQLIKKEQ